MEQDTVCDPCDKTFKQIIPLHFHCHYQHITILD
jgi:hypothetical protein